ncbi:hypothetical protein [Crossiella cryophila]|uniref:Uncharacterized protein n=1 Tax=Crossiella cryophila TaxID=43355 RepID=A0A7W7CD61_9PSEU|nr:hypothetical protein [Crossiella cryophila]MBB4678956.1 hypothetical protein [Crossiella cryophila]
MMEQVRERTEQAPKVGLPVQAERAARSGGRGRSPIPQWLLDDDTFEPHIVRGLD